MNRFFSSPEECRGDQAILSAAESHHSSVVLRLQPGDPVELLDGAGGRYGGVIERTSKRNVTVRITDRHSVIPRPGDVWLLAGLTKAKAWEATLLKATELGTAVIAPLCCERSVIRFAAGGAEARIADWLRIAGVAAKQCGTAWLPRILRPASVASTLTSVGIPELGVVAALNGGTDEFRGAWRRTTERLGRVPRTVAVAIGPEGDFTPQEYASLAGAGYQAVTLGPLVLRSDTAAVAALALIQHEMRVAAALGGRVFLPATRGQ